jgi:hypothetical protein
MNLRLSRSFDLPNDVAHALSERLIAAGAQTIASQVTYARSDPEGHQLPFEEWPKLHAVLDEWADEGGLDPQLEQLRRFLTAGTA